MKVASAKNEPASDIQCQANPTKKKQMIFIELELYPTLEYIKSCFDLPN